MRSNIRQDVLANRAGREPPDLAPRANVRVCLPQTRPFWLLRLYPLLYRRYLTVITYRLVRYLPTPAWFQFQRDVATLNNYVTGLIEKRWALRLREKEDEAAGKGPTSRHQDVLDKCLGAISPSEWCPAAVNQIQDEVKTFILAGHETSASMLTWSLYELSRPDEGGRRVLAELLKEAKSVFDGCMAPGSLSLLTYP